MVRVDVYSLRNIREILEKINALSDDERKKIGINWSGDYDYTSHSWIPNTSMNCYIAIIDELISRKEKETKRVKGYSF